MPSSSIQRSKLNYNEAVILMVNNGLTLSRAKHTGLPCFLTKEKVRCIFQLLLHCVARGVPVTKEELASLVLEQFGSNTTLQSRLKNGKLESRWIQDFYKRNHLNFKKQRKKLQS
eukprot:IDg7208t1